MSENDTSKTKNDDSTPDGEFVQLFSKHQRRLYLYILAQVANPVDAEEILQEANIIIWRKFETFQPGTNFFAWISRIASYEVLKFRDRRRRDRLYFSSEFLDAVSEEFEDCQEMILERRTALQTCLGKLRSKDQELIRQRYASGESGKKLARRLGRPVNSVYQSLGRIRKTLLECMRRQMAVEAGQS
ncbi:MAG: sigma-70 family RNA polymerase sigma factor [Planctomycetaceae bacterium]